MEEYIYDDEEVVAENYLAYERETPHPFMGGMRAN